jgi:hypothetical protein
VTSPVHAIKSRKIINTQDSLIEVELDLSVIKAQIHGKRINTSTSPRSIPFAIGAKMTKKNSSVKSSSKNAATFPQLNKSANGAGDFADFAAQLHQYRGDTNKNGEDSDDETRAQAPKIKVEHQEPTSQSTPVERLLSVNDFAKSESNGRRNGLSPLRVTSKYDA